MNKQLIFVGIALIAGIGFASFYKMPNTSLGSVSYGSEYHATSTRNPFDGTALSVPKLVASGPATFGSVIITGANTGVINIYDATTSNSGLRAASKATSTIILASFPASTAAGTYTFDVVVFDGLLVDVIGTAPTSTITFRN